MEFVEIYTDGACSGNPGPGGWGAVLIWRDVTKKISGYEAHTTNNRMELKAAIEAVRAIKGNLPIKIHTDSQYVKNGITLWLPKWLKSNWRNGQIKNVDLWRELDQEVQKHKIEWYWVRGHNGHEYNEMADELAREEITKNFCK